MRLEPRPTHLASLDVVQEDGDDRGPTCQKRPHDGGGADNARDQAESVHGVDDMRQFDQGFAWDNWGGHGALLTPETGASSRLLLDLIPPVSSVSPATAGSSGRAPWQS